ncbi:hypothetical protein RJ639_014730 [Escallonia herrerae]|uniref:F-box associated beta-propeller type 1 domain-containing protein n=1 Tax=Escallonia herrerae TaxID=1293975 RepID=A0AA88VLF9_9ASTE|nr:hypothetical protein RJ639_014730 [Escallonia herrerae]
MALYAEGTFTSTKSSMRLGCVGGVPIMTGSAMIPLTATEWLENPYSGESIFRRRSVGMGRTTSRAEVYSLSLDSWKNIDAANVPRNPLGTSVSFNRNIHWLPHELHEEGEGCVVLFNIGEESFGEMVLPDYRPAYLLNQYNMHTEIQVVNEALCLLVLRKSQSCFNIASYHDVWVMREYGVVGSWIKKFSVVLKDIWWVSRIRLSVNGKIYHYKYHSGNHAKVAVYDPADNHYRTVDVPCDSAFDPQVVNFKESLAFMDCQGRKGFYSGTLIAV